MSILLAIIGGIVGAVVGYVVAAVGAALYAAATGMSNFEDAAGMFAAFAIGPIGGAVGLILGIWLVLRWRRPRLPLVGIAGRIVVAVAAIAALTAGGLWLMYETRDIVNPNGAAPRLAFEIRLPPATSEPIDLKTFEVELHTDRNTMPGLLFERLTRRDGDRIVLGGQVELYFRTANRLLAVKRRGEVDRLFRLRIAANPPHTKVMSAWQRVDLVAGPGPGQPRPPAAGNDYDLRYRVVWVGED